MEILEVLEVKMEIKMEVSDAQWKFPLIYQIMRNSAGYAEMLTDCVLHSHSTHF